ncbi:MAG: hypothetical protein ABI743_12780 [bacterium]
MHRALRLTLIPAILIVATSGCNKSASDTNETPIITSVARDPASQTLEPGTAVGLTLAFDDPTFGTPDPPSSYVFHWTVAASGTTVAPANLAATMLIDDANPGRWEAPDQEGTYVVTGEVCDQYGACDSVDIPYTVEATNHAPRITASSATNLLPSVNEEVTFDVTATDEDGDTLNWDWAASKGSFKSKGPNQAVWIGNTFGGATVTVTVSDPDNASDVESFTLTVQ